MVIAHGVWYFVPWTLIQLALHIKQERKQGVRAEGGKLHIIMWMQHTLLLNYPMQ